MRSEKEQWEDKLRSELSSTHRDSVSLQQLSASLVCHDEEHRYMLPMDCRGSMWKIMLGIERKPNVLPAEAAPLPVQQVTVMIEDCIRCLEFTSHSNVTDATEVMSTLLSHYCLTRSIAYEPCLQLASLLAPFMSLDLSPSVLFNCFYTTRLKYVPQGDIDSAIPSVVFRLLLQYHDPKLCSHLDSVKLNLSTVLTPWLRSLFASSCSPNALPVLWDIYFLTADPFLAFYLALVMLINDRDTIMKCHNNVELSEMMLKLPNRLCVDDIADFVACAMHFASDTPTSFRTYHFSSLFSPSDMKIASSGTDVKRDSFDITLEQHLCMTVSTQELAVSLDRHNEEAKDDCKAYFIVDCRESNEYNQRPLPNLFNGQSAHLDPEAMLDSKDWLTSKMDLLMNLDDCHLCFLGGDDATDDPNMLQMVSYFLQRGVKKVSLLEGNYRDLMARLPGGLNNNYPEICDQDSLESASAPKFQAVGQRLKGMWFKTGTEMREKFEVIKREVQYAVEDLEHGYQTVSSSKFTGKNEDKEKSTSLENLSSKETHSKSSLFSIGVDDDDGGPSNNGDVTTHRGSSSTDLYNDMLKQLSCVEIAKWTRTASVIRIFTCNQIMRDYTMIPSYICLTSTHIVAMIARPDRRGWAYIRYKRPYLSLTKVLIKKHHQNLITLQFLESTDKNFALERYMIPDAILCANAIKQCTFKARNLEDCKEKIPSGQDPLYSTGTVSPIPITNDAIPPLPVTPNQADSSVVDLAAELDAFAIE